MTQDSFEIRFTGAAQKKGTKHFVALKIIEKSGW